MPVSPHSSDNHRAESRVDQSFAACIRYLNTPTAVKLQDLDRLKLYGFYKQATCVVTDEEGDYIEAMRKEPNLKIARAKWQAWSQVRKQGLSAAEAKLAYVNYVDNLAAAAKLPDWRASVGFEMPGEVAAEEEQLEEEDSSNADLVQRLQTKQRELESESLLSGKQRYCGYLLKKHRSEAIWELQFFVLDEFILSLYREHKPHGAPNCPQGVVYLYDCEVKGLGEAHLGPAPNDCFYLIGILHAPSKKHYFLGAPSERLAEEWVAKLKAAVAGLVTKGYEQAEEPVRAPEQQDYTGTAASRLGLEHSGGPSGEETARRFGIPSAEYAEKVNRTMAEVFRLFSSRHTRFYYENCDVQVYSNTKDSLPCAIGKKHIKAPSRAIWDLVWRVTRRTSIDPMLKRVKVIENLGQQTRVEHCVFSAVWPTLPRDFCNLSHWRVLDDGRTILIVNCSVSHPACPPVEGFIRAEIVASCLIVEPRADNFGCNVAYLIKSNPKGNTPHFMVTKVQSARPLVLNNISAALEPLYAEAINKSRLTSRPRNLSTPVTQKHRRRTLPSGSTKGTERRSTLPTNFTTLAKSGLSVTQYLRKTNRRRLARYRRITRSNYSVIVVMLVCMPFVAPHIMPSSVQSWVYIPLVLWLMLCFVTDMIITPHVYNRPYTQQSTPAVATVPAVPKEQDKLILKLKALTELSNQTTDEALKTRLNGQISSLLDRLEKI